MLKLFGATDRSFSSNGDLIIKPSKSRVHKEDNGEYYLDLTVGLEYVDHIVAGNIIVANTPQGQQAFRVADPVKSASKIETRAKHVYFDTENYLIADSYIIDKNCNAALSHLNAATEPTSIFTVSSDVDVINSYRCVRKSFYEAINTVLERWGGHLVRDNFSIGIRNSIGADNGVTVRYAKNLKEISVNEDWSAVVTKLLPVGKDGRLLPEVFVTAATSYDIPYTKTVTFSQDHIREENYQDGAGNVDTAAYEAALTADLRSQATSYVAVNCVPKVNYKLKANLEKVTDVGDTINVIDERLHLDLITHVISFDYDTEAERYTEIEFGNFQKTISGLASTLRSETSDAVDTATESVKVILSDKLKEATDKIWSVLGSSHVQYYGDRILVLDALPEADAHNVIMINSAGIGFSNTGINGTFRSAWTIDGTLDMQQINVINLVADLIRGGTLTLGGLSNQSGVLELYDENGNMIGLMNKDGLKMYGTDGSYVMLNNAVGFAGYDRNNNKIFWADKDEFHMKKSVVEEEITLCNKVRFIPIKIMNGNTVVNDGIGLVSVYDGGS